MSLRPTERTTLNAVIHEQRQEIARLRVLLRELLRMEIETPPLPPRAEKDRS